LTADTDYYQTIISALMLFIDSSFYIIPTFFAFIGLSAGTVLFFVALGLFLFLVGVNTPVILYTLATILVFSSVWLAALFFLILLFAPLGLLVGSLFVLIPWIMWLTLDN
jgi:hypothetical protein